MKTRRQFLASSTAFAGAIPLAFAKSDGWVEIGRDLKSWDGAPHLWRMENDVLIGETHASQPLKHHSYLIWRGGILSTERRVQT